MKILGMVLTVLYACVTILAVCKGRRKNIASAFILCGSLLILAYGSLNVFMSRHAAVLLIVGITGMAAISIGALINGMRQNHIHISHHIIRLVIESIIIALCAF